MLKQQTESQSKQKSRGASALALCPFHRKIEPLVAPCGVVMKPKAAKKLLLPRRTWKINPLTKVKASDKIYSRKKAKKIASSDSGEA